MHTQNEQKKSQISHNELINNALSTFALLTDKTDYIKLHIFFTDYISQPVGTKKDTMKLHKLRGFFKREIDICIDSRSYKKINTCAEHCASHCAIKKLSRYMSLYNYICIICILCNYLVYLLIFPRVKRVTCFATACNFARSYVISYSVSRVLFGSCVYREHSTCAETISFNYVHNHALGAPLSLCCT